MTQDLNRRHDDFDESGASLRRDGIERRWSIDHKIPVTLILTLILQTGAGVVFFTNLSNKVDKALELMAEFRAERYTKDDARRDRELYQAMLGTAAARDIEIDRRLDMIEREIAEHRKNTGNGHPK